jgi:hypothetical protein
MSNLTVQRLGDEAQLDNEPHRLDYMRRDIHDRQITSHKLGYREIAALGLVAVPGWLIILATVWTVYAVQSWNVPEYAWTTSLWLFYDLAVFVTLLPAVVVVAWLVVLAWARIVRVQAETMRARITRDRYSNPIDARAVLTKTQQQVWSELLLATQAEVAMAPFKQFPAGLDSLSMNQTIQAPKQELLPAPESNLLSIDQWRAALDENPHLLIYGPSKAGKSTLAQAVVSMFSGCEYVVIDPQRNKPNERKWNGIDFITTDKGDGDEYMSIKAALQHIRAEDDRRRRNLDSETFTPLVVIIDEVLALVGALGTIKNGEGRTEARMSHFIRTMGYSARHRNIKIILIGQGKNLSDLGLNSGTARNNYALVRAARDQVTNEHAAFIITDDGEQPLDVRQVLRLAQGISHNAQVWLTHTAARDLPCSDSRSILPTINLPSAPDQDRTEQRDALARALFRKGNTVRTVADAVRYYGFSIDNDRLIELRQEALNGRYTASQ